MTRRLTVISNVLLTLVDPFQIGRNYVLHPVWNLLQDYYKDTKEKTHSGLLSARDLIFRLIIVLFAFGIILSTAVFMYICFYYTYVPLKAHARPAHMQFTSCEAGKGVCSYPQAYVSLTKRQQLLMVGQPYRVLVVIEMPESPVNQNLGMFQVCAEMREQGGELKGHSCRTAILHYKSDLLNWIATWIRAPLYMFGLREEKQLLEVELFSTFHDDNFQPVTDVYVEIQSKQIEFYSVSLHITAHFTGLRYLMFHWPLLAATVGICTNLFVIIFVSLLSWYHYSTDGEWIEEAKVKLRNRAFRKSGSELDSSTSSMEDAQSLHDDDDDDNTNENENDLIEEISSTKEKPKKGLFRRVVKSY